MLLTALPYGHVWGLVAEKDLGPFNPSSLTSGLLSLQPPQSARKGEAQSAKGETFHRREAGSRVLKTLKK